MPSKAIFSGDSQGIPMPILTPRLSLRLIKLEDSPAMFEARCESYTELSKWGTLIWRPLNEMTIEENDKFCQMKSDQFAARKDITILAFNRDTGQLIGGGGLHECNWEQRTFSLGYWVRTSQTGKGYASEMAKGLIDYAFDDLSATQVTSSHGEGNNASQRILQKRGFELITISENTYSMLDGSKIDDYLYALNSKV